MSSEIKADNYKKADGTSLITSGAIGSAVTMSANQACVKTALNASGDAPIFACRAWVNFDGTAGSIGSGRANGNVSGVTDNGTADYTVNFTTAFADTNYAVAGWVRSDATSPDAVYVVTSASNGTKTTSAMQFVTRYASGSSSGAVDFPEVDLAFFR